MDATIAALTYDSVLDEAVAGVRAADTPRLVTFEAGDVQIEVQVATLDDGRRLVGQVVPTRGGMIELHARTARWRRSSTTWAGSRSTLSRPVPCGCSSARTAATPSSGPTG
jgi:hypothetical protein